MTLATHTQKATCCLGVASVVVSPRHDSSKSASSSAMWSRFMAVCTYVFLLLHATCSHNVQNWTNDPVAFLISGIQVRNLNTLDPSNLRMFFYFRKETSFDSRTCRVCCCISLFVRGENISTANQSRRLDCRSERHLYGCGDFAAHTFFESMQSIVDMCS